MPKGFVSERGLEHTFEGNFPRLGKFPWSEHNGRSPQAPEISRSVPLPEAGGGPMTGRGRPDATRAVTLCSAPESGHVKYPPDRRVSSRMKEQFVIRAELADQGSRARSVARRAASRSQSARRHSMRTSLWTFLARRMAASMFARR